MKYITLVVLITLVGAPAIAQTSEPKPAETTQVQPGATKTQLTPDEPARVGQPASQPPDLPSLDELLGLPGAKPSQEQDRARAELQERLSAAQMADQFQQAVALMGEAATRLQKARDTGIVTQRIQEDILRKLDQLIDAAQQQQQQQSGSSSRSQRNQQQQQQPNQPQNQQAGDVENFGEVDPPGREDPRFNPDVAPNQASWGALPERIREALRQAGDDRFSSLYKSLTEAYYRRLAEEAGR